MLTSRLVDKVVPARDQLNIEGAKVRESVGSPEVTRENNK